MTTREDYMLLGKRIVDAYIAKGRKHEMDINVRVLLGKGNAYFHVEDDRRHTFVCDENVGKHWKQNRPILAGPERLGFTEAEYVAGLMLTEEE